MVATNPLTADDLAAMEEELGAGRHELVEGELQSMAAAFVDHGEVAGEFAGHLWSVATPRRLGKVFGAETGFILRRDPDTVRVPDVAFVRTERLPPLAKRHAFMPEAPDIAVEVASDSDRRRLLPAKIAMDLARGVSLVWVADPLDRTVTVHAPHAEPRVLGEDDVLEAVGVLPGFAVRVGEFFPTE